MDRVRDEDLHWLGAKSDKAGQDITEGRKLCFYPFKNRGQQLGDLTPDTPLPDLPRAAEQLEQAAGE
ncbi:hypothetical protein EYF80_018218 [Liparis tanakae]|uniref:Uncharacterized protein n=1 Tax=Liparis tanakae TaxID=230148 RepID=A0A4Z2I2Q3_9TELE|nr:hypothetical protein EYF80_018218 [Liparis tanakae]